MNTICFGRPLDQSKTPLVKWLEETLETLADVGHEQHLTSKTQHHIISIILEENIDAETLALIDIDEFEAIFGITCPLLQADLFTLIHTSCDQSLPSFGWR
jgi:hypothetical protein